MSFINMRYKHGTSNINKQLQIAIKERKSEEVKVLLSTGADINHTVNQNLDTMLHTTRSPAVARDLLGYSANINAKNLYSKLPLHSAAQDGKSSEFIKTLTDHCPDIDAMDSEGNTALNYAVKNKDRNLEVIKELILNGADANNTKTTHLALDNACSPIDDAILLDDIECVKVIIKYSLLKSYDTLDLDLTTYYMRPGFPIFLSYSKSCRKEFCLMRQEMLGDNASLYKVIFDEHVCRHDLYKDKKDLKLFTERCLAVVTSNSYAIYNDVITKKLSSKLETEGLVEKLSSMLIYTQSGHTKIVLTSDVITNLAKFLLKNDLFSLLLAFYNPKSDGNLGERSIVNGVNIQKQAVKRTCEPSTSSGSIAKKVKTI